MNAQQKLIPCNVEDTEQRETSIQEPDRIGNEQTLVRHGEDSDENSRCRIGTPEDGKDGKEITKAPAIWI